MPPKKKARVADDPLTVVCFGESNTHGVSSEGGSDRLPFATR